MAWIAQSSGTSQALSDVAAYPYLLAGTALASPLPDVQNFATVYESNVSQLTWDESTDFRQPLLELRKGNAQAASGPARMIALFSILTWVTVAAGGRWIGLSP